jgi:hypothetical protein
MWSPSTSQPGQNEKRDISALTEQDQKIEGTGNQTLSSQVTSIKDQGFHAMHTASGMFNLTGAGDE